MAEILCGCFGGECQKGRDETDGGKSLKYDADFRGPIRAKARRPKDILCLGLFLAFIIFMLAIAIFAWASGTPRRILYPTDSQGRLCGVDEEVRDRPNLLFFEITQCATIISVSELISGSFDASALFTCPTPQVCVAACPNSTEFGVRNNPVCLDRVDVSPYTDLSSNPLAIPDLLEEIANSRCAPYYIASTEVARRCIPTFGTINVDEILTINTSQEIQDSAGPDFEGLARNVSINDILDGTFTDGVLTNTRQFLMEVYEDLQVVWPALLIGVILAMVFSFAYILMLWCCAPVIVWTGILLALLVVAFISAFSFYQFYCFQQTGNLLSDFTDSNSTISEYLDGAQSVANQICVETDIVRQSINTLLPWFEYQEETWLAVGIISVILLLILILILIALGKKIRISIAIMQEASKAVGGVPTSVFFPIVIWLLLIGLFFYWGAVALFLLTASDATYGIIMNGSTLEENRNITGLGPVENGTTCTPESFETSLMNMGVDTMQTVILFVPHESLADTNVSIACQFDRYVTTNFLLGLQIYHFFGLLWIGGYFLALGECTLAGAFASWYWAFRKPKDVPLFAVLGSFGRAILFHSGSLAFGALIIAILQLIRAIFAYIKRKLKGREGSIGKALLCIFQCCLWCLEKFLKYINRQAYIEIAIYGYDFCTAACKVIKLLIRNILTTAVKDRIVAFLLFLGKLAIIGGIGVLAYLGFGPYEEQGRVLWGRPLNYYLIPVIILIIAAYFISSAFLGVYHMAVDTIYICALEDLERNNGKDQPYFMSKKLMNLLNVKNKVEQPDGGDVLLESVENIH